MIGSPTIHSSPGSQHCQGTCMTIGALTCGLRVSREKDTPGHLQAVLQPLEKAVVPMGVILMVVNVVIHMAHVVHRQGGLVYVMQINSLLDISLPIL